MANNKMLIDASHPEETRVVVVRGNRIEEFDFEAQERRQLRGNIYLAKVTRVEPSLQAAFIDYGGNRHGFLAFSEIHPDYYQIPAADRQALLDAEEEAAAAVNDDEADAVEIESAADQPDGDEENTAPKKKTRRKPRRSRSKKAKQEAENEGDENQEQADTDSSDGDVKAKSDITKSEKDADKGSEDESSVSNDADDGSEDDDSGSKTMAAMMDMDTISEPASDDDNDEPSDEGDSEAVAEEKPKKKRRTSRRKPAKKAETEETVEEASPETPAEASVETTESAAEKSDIEVEATEAVTEAITEEKAAKKPAKRRTSRRKPKAAKDDTADDKSDDKPDDKADDANGNGVSVESVGQEDALAEVAVRRPRRQYKIQDVIRRRQVMLVQVVKEERGNKGAALTTYLSLAGRYSVLMPNTARGGGISRKITNVSDRKRLKEIAGSFDVPKGMGVILRTAGASREKEEIERDFDYLMRLWENVRNLTLESSAPFLVYEEGSLIKRSIRDLYNKDIGEIIVSGEDGYKEASDFMRMMMPDHVKNVKFYNGEQPLLSKFNMESQLEKMVSPQVTLKSGGYLIINQTEALVAIDVNSGRSTKEHSIEATALQTNLEAAEEVARQLRLRDLAGLVVIDFIDMEEKRNNRAVERKLKDCLKNDRARIQVGHISHFGLMEMSRQRIRASVLESTMAVCPVCQGVGHVRSDSSFALHVLREINDHLNRHSRNDVAVKIAPSVALFILNNKREAVSELENRFGVSISFESDHNIQAQDFTIEKGPAATREPKGQKAVNPMEFENESADIGASSSNGTSSNSSEADDEANRGNGRRNKRRRGRGRGKGRDQENGGNSEAAASHSETNSEDSKASDSGAETPVAKDEVKQEASEEKPRRGRRPRKSVNKEADGQDDVSKNEAKTEVAEKVAFDAVAEQVDEMPAEPRRRTGRPGKKASAEVTPIETPEKQEEAGETVKTGAPPRAVKRRNTKRVRAKKPETSKAADISEDDNNDPSGGGFTGFLS